MRFFWIRESVWWGRRLRSAAGSDEFAVQPLESLCRAIVGTEPEDDAPLMLDQATGAVDVEVS